MTTFNIIRISDGERITGYTASSVITDGPYPLTEYNHVALPSENLPASDSVFGGRRDLTHGEFRLLFAEEEQWGMDEFEITFEQHPYLSDSDKRRIRTGYKSYYAGTFVSLDDPRVEMLLGVFAGLQLIAIHRIGEILNG